ncbi:GSCFA domain-containing protein [Pseudomonas putida]|uniref:GSCFA domain-containing protein n=1 Tax=Pseudomonas putida TaxID=303 RepID=UPI0018ABC036|nr:GSCFA domain-containing protein [Pseudomonas putida]MBF8651235.1 GSCFA domain-containing protein [Pseudomonas putida]MBF8654931.1 GSCFA domain-containing protein [Pseudomonas putida]
MKFSGQKAFDTAKNNQHRLMPEWASNRTDYPTVHHKPKFKLPLSGKYFTIGSCFARNVENSLRSAGINVLSTIDKLPGDYFEIGGESRSGYQNVYTPGAILEAVKLASTESPYTAIVGSEEKSIDLLTSGLKPLDLGTVRTIRESLIKMYSMLPDADALIITLGYNESWYHLPSQTYINRTPSHVSLRRKIDDFEFELLDYAKSFELVDSAINRVHKLAPNCKVILTVSPVPLSATFSNKDIVTANQLSKSTLRVIASAISEKYAHVDYFPSYEIIMNSERSKTFLDDGIHVRAEAVNNVIRQFKDLYLS